MCCVKAVSDIEQLNSMKLKDFLDIPTVAGAVVAGVSIVDVKLLAVAVVVVVAAAVETVVRNAEESTLRAGNVEAEVDDVDAAAAFVASAVEFAGGLDATVEVTYLGDAVAVVATFEIGECSWRGFGVAARA